MRLQFACGLSYIVSIAGRHLGQTDTFTISSQLQCPSLKYRKRCAAVECASISYTVSITCNFIANCHKLPRTFAGDGQMVVVTAVSGSASRPNLQQFRLALPQVIHRDMAANVVRLTCRLPRWFLLVTNATKLPWTTRSIGAGGFSII